jgi:phenylpropionate dioxygenase-like ring-hydroxylating dioxygenase large terminal subunit
MDPSNVDTDIASPTNTPTSRADGKPPTATRSLPGVAYTDPVLYEQELTEVFQRAWILVGHLSELSEPGHYVTANVGREPIVVIRGHDGELRAMSNVCRHRASTILEGTGQTRSVMRCPYHAWTYELDGRLAAAPSGQGFACLDRDQVALPQFRVGVAGGLVFCCLDPDQMSLADMLGPVGPYLEWLNVSGLQVHRGPDGARWTEDFDENWKVLADNYLEDYHVPVAHPTLVRLVDVSRTIGDNNDWCEWSRVPYRTRPSRDPREREYQTLVRRMPGMPEEFESAMGHVCIWPTTFFEIYPHHIDMWWLEPTGQLMTRATTMTLVHPDEGEQDRRARELMRELNVDIMGQDVEITTRVQRGVQAPSYHSGILNDEQEFSVIRFQKRLRELLPRIAELEATATGERSVASS